MNRLEAQARDPAPTVLVGVAAIAWLALGAWWVSPAGRYLDHRVLERSVSWVEVAALATGWTLMVFAMMVPMLVPLVRRVHSGRVGLVAGYVLVWSVFGLIAHLGDHSLHQTVDAHPWLGRHQWVVLTGTITLAGVWQLCELKDRCLARCRAAIAEPANGMRAVGGFGAGVDYGRYCAGSCWALMLLVFALGMGNIAWMALFGAVMLAERAGARVGGVSIGKAAGLLLLGWAGVGMLVAVAFR